MVKVEARTSLVLLLLNLCSVKQFFLAAVFGFRLKSDFIFLCGMVKRPMCCLVRCERV